MLDGGFTRSDAAPVNRDFQLEGQGEGFGATKTHEPKTKPDLASPSAPIHIISLGAGVQSSTMALMAAAGEITPMPKLAVFADTMDEPEDVYVWFERLRSMLPFHVDRVWKGKLSDNLCEWGHSQIPAFRTSDKGGVSMGKRQCTSHYKIEPIHKLIRRKLDIFGKRTTGVRAILWIGISTDEISRAKDSREHWLEHRFPLIELGMSRRDCQQWMSKHGHPKPPKSACVYCPYRSRSQWAETKRIGGKDWELCLKVSKTLEERGEFLTKECLPIDQVDFSTDEERGQLNMFENDCEGMCGV